MNPGPGTRPCRAGPAHVVTVLAGLREPIVVILLLIAFFTWISGKPLDGLLMLVVGVSLAWDTGRRARRGGAPEGRPAGHGRPPGRGTLGTAGGPGLAGRWRPVRPAGRLVQPLLLAGHRAGGRAGRG